MSAPGSAGLLERISIPHDGLAARGKSEGREKSGTANQFAQAKCFFYRAIAGGELVAVPIFRS